MKNQLNIISQEFIHDSTAKKVITSRIKFNDILMLPWFELKTSIFNEPNVRYLPD